PDALLESAAVDAEHLALIRNLGLRSAIVAPLKARGRTFGALTLVTAESGRRYTQADRVLVEEIGERAGLAVDNPRLLEAQPPALRSLRVRAGHDRTVPARNHPRRGALPHRARVGVPVVHVRAARGPRKHRRNGDAGLDPARSPVRPGGPGLRGRDRSPGGSA